MSAAAAVFLFSKQINSGHLMDCLLLYFTVHAAVSKYLLHFGRALELLSELGRWDVSVRGRK